MAGNRPPQQRRRARRIRAVLLATVLVATGVTAATLAGAWTPQARAQATPPPGCTGDTLPPPAGSPDPLWFAPEHYPASGLPRGAGPVPYAIPFAGYMEDGTLTVGTGNLNVLGPSIADLCGTFSLPSDTGTSTPDQLGIHNPVPVHVAATVGPTAYNAYIVVTAPIVSQIAPVPGSNGGLNLTLTASFAGTLVPAPGGVDTPQPGFECTTEVGPITFTTQTSGKLTGKPVTGPINDANTYVVANDFPYPAVDPNAPPTAPTPAKDIDHMTLPGDTTPCDKTTGATAIDTAGGLPQKPGNATFTAHAIFAVHASA